MANNFIDDIFCFQSHIVNSHAKDVFDLGILLNSTILGIHVQCSTSCSAGDVEWLIIFAADYMTMAVTEFLLGLFAHRVSSIVCNKNLFLNIHDVLGKALPRLGHHNVAAMILILLIIVVIGRQFVIFTFAHTSYCDSINAMVHMIFAVFPLIRRLYAPNLSERSSHRAFHHIHTIKQA